MKQATHAARALALVCLVQGLVLSTAAGTGSRPAAPSGKQQPAAKPPAGYVQLQDVGHYKARPERLSWSEAQAACQAEGAHLVVLNSKKEATAVAEFLALQPASVSNELHAGFFLPDYFVTVFGKPLSSVGYQKWAPNQQQTQICGSINRAGLLFDAKCSDQRSFICEFKKDTSAFKLNDPQIILPDVLDTSVTKYEPKTIRADDMGSFKGLVQQGRLHYYLVEKTKMRWSQANLACKEKDAHLLVVNHQAEADALKEHLKQFTGLTDFLYVGLRNGQNKFVTVFGKTPSGAGYAQWESEQPDDETCLAIDKNILLKKVPCWEAMSYICERTLA